MPVLHKILSSIRKSHIGIQIASLLGESFDPAVCGKAIVVTSVTDYKGSFMDRGIVSLNYLLEIFIREVPLNTLGRSLITCFEDVDAFRKHRVY
jgi:hypothetical protein